MKRLLTIGQAAERLGLAVDTVRRLEAKGELRAHRTPGGHRRFHVAVLDAYRKGTGQRSRSKPGRRVSPKPKRPPVQPVDSFLDQVDEPDEWTEFDPDDPDEWVDYESPVTRAANKPVVPSFSQHASPSPIDSVPSVPAGSAADAEKIRGDDTSRLQTIRNWGLVAIPAGTPALWRAKVTQDLECNVTAEKFPVGLPLNDAIELVRGRVSEVLEPYEEQKTRQAQTAEDERIRAAEEREEAEEERQIRKLVAHGEHYAWRETISWDREDRHDAREEIGEVLGARVGADWSEDDVEELVDDILDKYADDD